MPTIASQPSLESTQAVGAILLHQFVRQRFQEAGVEEELIQQAESTENVDRLIAAQLMQEEEDSLLLNESATTTTTTTTANVGGDSVNQSASIDGRDESRRGDQFYSMMADSVMDNEQSVYHSLNHGRSSSFTSEHLQSSTMMSYYGQQLRQIAEEFEKSRERQILRDSANSVKLEEITRESFIALLEELFQDKITREKIVVLFFFCTDVALRAASFAKELVIKLLGWSFSYIINTVCRVVHDLGGWEHVLCRQIPTLLITCFAALGICAFAIYLRKSLLTQASE